MNGRWVQFTVLPSTKLPPVLSSLSYSCMVRTRKTQRRTQSSNRNLLWSDIENFLQTEPGVRVCTAMQDQPSTTESQLLSTGIMGCLYKSSVHILSSSIVLYHQQFFLKTFLSLSLSHCLFFLSNLYLYVFLHACVCATCEQQVHTETRRHQISLSRSYRCLCAAQCVCQEPKPGALNEEYTFVTADPVCNSLSS